MKKIVVVVVFLVVLIIGLILLPVALAFALLAGSGGGSAQACSSALPASAATTPKPTSGGGPPAQFIPIYQAAAAKYQLGTLGPSTLAAIHGVESAFGQNMSTSSAGAIGQMQFEPGTWATYGVDGNNDGKKDPYNAQDAIFSAAHYLRASGAPKHWYQAIYAYNHAGWYVDEVQSKARQYNIPATGNAAAQNSTADCTPAGSGDYINPFNPGGAGNGPWQANRTDMGVDWCLSSDQPIRAIGHAQVTYSTTSANWPGGGFIVYKLLDGDHQGDYIFVAEQIKDLTKAPTEVQAGEKIGTAVANSSCTTEWGWNGGPDTQSPRAFPCYKEGDVTNSGKEMARFFKSLGAKPADDPGPGPDFPSGPLC